MTPLDQLKAVMIRLRDPDGGCPWDVEQTFASIAPYTVEEAYEVADAIDRAAWDELPGELGDLLFQVVYYSQLAREEGRFDFATVVDAITRKLVRRHPHVFPDGDLYGSPELPRLDEAAIKRAEAATRRVLGWTDAAKRGCAELGRAGDRQCEEQLLKDAATYSIAKEGHEGVIISVGAPVSVAVDPNARRTGAE